MTVALRTRLTLLWAVLAGLLVSACTSSSLAPGTASSGTRTASAGSGVSPTPVVTAAPTPTTQAPSPTTTPLGKPVRVSSLQGDGMTYGVGMPLIIRFSVSPTSKAAFEAAATVSVNGTDPGGAWFWQKPFADQPMEAHYRPKAFWPAHSRILVDLPVQGLSAGAGLSYANSLTLNYAIGAYHYARVDAQALRMTVYADGKVLRTIAVSLGKADTPTYSGTKVVMQKNNPTRMVGPGYDLQVPYSVRLTNSGEFVHAAPWNSEIGQASTSHGCTNLAVADAAWFYAFVRVGDVVQYPNAPGQQMPSWDGYGDWNVPWSTWLTGGRLAA